MQKNNIILVIVHFLIFSGCVSVQTVGQKAYAPTVTVGMGPAEVVKIMNKPDFVSYSDGRAAFFYCPDIMQNTAEVTCTPIYFKDNRVVEVGEKKIQKWALDNAAAKVEQNANREMEKPAEPFSEIVEDPLPGPDAYLAQKGDVVYVSYYRSLVSYVPMRATPSANGEILDILCIGSALDVLDVQPPWLWVKEVDHDLSGWLLNQWVTNDPSVKIAVEKRRKAQAPEIARLEAIVSPLPQSEWRENLRLYRKLLELDPCNLRYQRKVDFYTNYGRKLSRLKRK